MIASTFFESGVAPLTLLPPTGKPTTPTLDTGGELSGFTSELQTAVEAVRTGKEPDLLRGQLARDALALCHKECASVKAGQPVAVS